jgi:putative peptidoglycan lipid II flippase
MVNKIIKKGQEILTSSQNSVLSAAALIMFMVIASRVLGLVRQRVLAYFFVPDQLSLFFAAFRLPDMIFEVLVFGTFSSAFIPVFAKLISKDQKEAWKVSSSVTNIGAIFYAAFLLFVFFLATPIYRIFAPGYSPEQVEIISKLTKVLFLAQGFFIISYVLTGVLESMRKFLVPALAPIFYNLGIIIGTILFFSRLGLMAPVVGVVLGALLHFLIQLPLALKLGFKFSSRIHLDKEVKKIGRLAFPRVIEVSFLQLSKLAELFFASLVSTASYTYYTFGNSLQVLPVGLFGTSIAKAALPTLSLQSDSKDDFAKTLWKSLYEMTFLILPVATFLLVLRIPVVRLVYGTDIFTWEATVQTSMVLSAFAISVVFQAASALLARAFYALHDTKTPVVISICSILINIGFDILFISVFKTQIWGLALAFSVSSFVQAFLLYYLINKKINGGFKIRNLIPFFKHLTASGISGVVMFFFLKLFDKWAWVKRLSFLGKVDMARGIVFQRFVLDTRYTINLLILTAIVCIIGIVVYLGASYILRARELWIFFRLVKQSLAKKKTWKLQKEKEQISPSTMDTSAN